jgi:hypothetical protein
MVQESVGISINSILPEKRISLGVRICRCIERKRDKDVG